MEKYGRRTGGEDGREGKGETDDGEVSDRRWCREMETVVVRGVISRSQATRVEPFRRGTGSEANRSEI